MDEKVKSELRSEVGNMIADIDDIEARLSDLADFQEAGYYMYDILNGLATAKAKLYTIMAMLS